MLRADSRRLHTLLVEQVKAPTRGMSAAPVAARSRLAAACVLGAVSVAAFGDWPLCAAAARRARRACLALARRGEPARARRSLGFAFGPGSFSPA